MGLCEFVSVPKGIVVEMVDLQFAIAVSRQSIIWSVEDVPPTFCDISLDDETKHSPVAQLIHSFIVWWRHPHRIRRRFFFSCCCDRGESRESRVQQVDDRYVFRQYLEKQCASWTITTNIVFYRIRSVNREANYASSAIYFLYFGTDNEI